MLSYKSPTSNTIIAINFSILNTILPSICGNSDIERIKKPNENITIAIDAAADINFSNGIKDKIPSATDNTVIAATIGHSVEPRPSLASAVASINKPMKSVKNPTAAIPLTRFSTGNNPKIVTAKLLQYLQFLQLDIHLIS